MIPTVIVRTKNFRAIRTSPERMVVEKLDGTDALGTTRWQEHTSYSDPQLKEGFSFAYELLKHIELEKKVNTL